MFTEEEVMALIEEAFESGYDSALDEILDESEDSAYNLESEMDAFMESSKNVRRQMDRLNSSDDKKVYARYINGNTAKDDDNLDVPDSKAINKGLNWGKYAKRNDDSQYGPEYVNYMKGMHNSQPGSDSTWDGRNDYNRHSYIVGNQNKREYKSSPRGRIKVDDKPERSRWADDRKEKLKKAIAHNKELIAARKDRETAKINKERAQKRGLFKNKGNSY